MADYWGIRTSKEVHSLIGEHLSQGVLRQGWGAHDLRDIGRLVEAGEADDETRSVWRYTKRMLDIEPGDIVLTPHQPEWGKDGVWRVTRPYSFDALPDIWGSDEPDFGHVLHVEQLGLIDPRSAEVSSQLRRALTVGWRTRMRYLGDFRDEIERLLTSPGAASASDAAEHFEAVRARTRHALGEALINQYGNADFERPIGAMLETLYPESVSHTAGPAERGRDFVVEDEDALGLSRTVIVQVKSWSGDVTSHDLAHGLGQLAQGIEAQGGNVDLAVLLTLADQLPTDADKVIAGLENEQGVRVRVLLKDDTLDLMLSQMAHIKL